MISFSQEEISMMQSDNERESVVVDKYSEPQAAIKQKDTLYGCQENKQLKHQRQHLEEDVFMLQDKLKQEVELHGMLKYAFKNKAGGLLALPKLPEHIKQLFMEISLLEESILNLEEQVAFLNWQLGYEQRERQRAEGTLSKLPMKMYSHELQSEHRSRTTALTDVNSIHHPSCISIVKPSPPQFCSPLPTSNVKGKCSRAGFTSPGKGTSQNVYSADSDCSFLFESVQSMSLGCSGPHLNSNFSSPEKLESKYSIHPYRTLYGQLTSKAMPVGVENCWHKPNKLSQKMLKCMVRIYKNLAQPINDLSSLSNSFSPRSLNEKSRSASLPATSDSSFVECPDASIHSIDIESEGSFDPYRTPMKIPWTDIGGYSKAIVVSQMCVGKEKLDYASDTLRTFRSLVQQLSLIDPSKMRHEEKLAFWINVYNALMMHAYLAYGVPENDFKFFTLMQKAAYTVGGHSFSAVVIEHLLLKAKPQWYRPQIALLLDRQTLKLREEVNMFAIDHAEPLVTFGLSFGARSCPAVRMYTAENVHQELQSALQDYACASVGISARGRLLIPKLLFEFGCHMVEESIIMEWICQLIPCKHTTLIRSCWMYRQEAFPNTKPYAVLPFDFQFQYSFLLGQISRGIR